MELPKYPGAKPSAKREAADRKEPSLYPLADETLASGVCEATIPGKAPYQLKGWLVYGTNLIQALPDPSNTERAIQELDFIAAIDVLPAEITGWADVVLPESTYLERFDDVWSPAYKQPFIAMRQPAVKPMYESRPGWWIAKELARRLGLADSFAWKDPVDFAKWRVQTGGHDFAKLLRDGVLLGERQPVAEEEGVALSFDTPSGKIELHSATLAAAGFDPLPNYEPHEEPPEGMFRLLFGRAPMHTFGRTANNRFLGEVFNENELWINTIAAKSLPGFEEQPLKSGEYVVLENQDGVRSNRIKAKVTERIRGDAVYLVHGWGHTAKGLRFAKGRGACDAGLVTRFKTDPIMGGTGMYVNFVRVVRAETT
jgi:thiosulfate reductase/polysulfide reductase chain A